MRDIQEQLFHRRTLVAASEKPKAEAVVQRCSLKKLFLEISLNSQENNCARVSFFTALGLQLCQNRVSNTGVVSVNFANTFLRMPFFYKTPPLPASVEASNFTKDLTMGAFM